MMTEDQCTAKQGVDIRPISLSLKTDQSEWLISSQCEHQPNSYGVVASESHRGNGPHHARRDAKI
eukprot:6481929-Amphidinium_carterae.1